MKNYKNNILLLVAGITLVVGMFAHTNNVEAVTVTDSMVVPYGILHNNWWTDSVGLAVQHIMGSAYGDIRNTINLSLSKNFNLIREDGRIVGSSSNLEVGKTLSASNSNTTGSWINNEGQTKTLNASNWQFHNWTAGSAGQNQQMMKAWGALSPVESNNNIEIVSLNPNIVSCANSVCTAISAGTATVKVKFTETQKSGLANQALKTYSTASPAGEGGATCGSGGKAVTKNISTEEGKSFFGSNTGFGRIAVATNVKWCGVAGGEKSNLKTLSYSYPNIEYTITVPAAINQPQIVSCTGIDEVTNTSARIGWSYFDVDGGNQKDYKIRLSKTNFGTVVKNKTSPPNTNVSGVRSNTLYNLDPETRYFAQVQSFNEPNGWSDWKQCSSSFTTLKDPVNGDCGATVNTCTAGVVNNIPDSTSQYLWNCLGTPLNVGTNASCSVPIPYTVSYNGNGGTGSVVSQTANANTDVILRENGFIREGYTFTSWKEITSPALYNPGTSVNIGIKNRIFYAQWISTPVSTTYTITYDGNGNTSGIAPKNQIKTPNVSIVIQTNTGNLQKTNHTFGGWNTRADGEGTSYAAGSTYTGNANLNLHAKWNPMNIPPPQNLQVICNTDVTGGNSITATWKRIEGYSDIYFRASPTATWNGTIWTDQSLWANNVKADSRTVNVDANKEYTVWIHTQVGANYSPQLTKKITCPGVSEPPTDGQCDNTTINSCSSPLPAINGHIDPAGRNAWTCPGSNGGEPDYCTLSNNLSYTISYNGNGADGDTITDSQTGLVAGSQVQLRENRFEKSGHTFVAWTRGAAEYAEGATITMPSQDIEFRAKWEEDGGGGGSTYKITYHPNGGEGNVPSQTGINAGETRTLLNNNFYLSGYGADGWKTSPTATSKAHDDGDSYTMPAHNVTMYSHWKVINPTDNPTFKNFYFSPSIANSNDTCPLYLEVINTSGCIIKNRLNQITGTYFPVSGIVDINIEGGESAEVGTYTLYCSTVADVGANPVLMQVPARSCYSNGDIKED